MKKKLLLVVLAICLALVGSTNANLLVNPSFEDDIDDDGVPDGWALDYLGYYGASAWLTYVEDDAAGANSGDDYLDMGTDGASGGGYEGYAISFQDVVGSEGQEYFISAYVSADSAVTNSNVELKLEYRDSGGVKIGQDVIGQTFSRDGTYRLVSASMTAPAGTASVRPGLVYVGFAPGGSILFDDAYLGTSPRPAGAHDPNPSDIATVSTALTQLSWTNIDPENPADDITVDVYFLDAGTAPLVNDPNLGPDTVDPGVLQLADDLAIETVGVPSPPLTFGHYYYWAVHTTDPNTGGTEVVTPGQIWSFFVGDALPVADAGQDQYDWLDPTVATVELNGLVTDDGVSAVTTLWSTVDAEVTITNPTALNTTATITATGAYAITLTATDGSGAHSDIMISNVYDDPCAAATADPTDGSFLGDISGPSDVPDCQVDLLDFAAMAADWLGCMSDKLDCTP